MTLIHAIASVFFKIVVAAVMVLLSPPTPIDTPTTLTQSPWQLPINEQVATTTLPSPAPVLGVRASVTSTKKTISAATPTKSKPTLAQTVVQTPQVIVPTLPSTSSETPSELNQKTREALVNVLCITGSGGYLKPISGTGVIIDPRGVVLTNAHIGQFFLLKDYPSVNNIQCVLRTGSPAEPTYTAELLYFPKTWLDKNAEKIVQENPTGTGENDFSLLFITGRTNPLAPLPPSFSYLEPYTGSDIEVGNGVLLAGYPAGFLQGATITTNLYIASALATIGQIFTFTDGGGPDLVSAGGTILSQKGSSGGAMVREDTGKLEGIIATATFADTTDKRDLRAITLRHVNLSMKEDTGVSLSSYLTGNLREKADAFTANKVPALSKMLTDVLNK